MNTNNLNPEATAMNNEHHDLQHSKIVPIAGYLHTTYGIEPAKRYNDYVFYHVSYREDSNASMKVGFWENLWHDYGTGQGGSITDLVTRTQGCSAHEAMKHLVEKRETIIAPSSFHREDYTEYRRDEQRADNRRHILSISDELSPHLQHYLRKAHKIDLAAVSGYLRHIHCEVGGREYSTIGFPNRSGGYEFRDDNAFKGTIAPKDISVIVGREDNIPLYIFEGFMGLLSLLMINGKETAPYLVLNSASNISRAIAYLQEQDIDSVRAFLDNDLVGRQAFLTIQSSNVTIKDMSRHYARYKDFNEFLVAQREAQEQKIVLRKRGLRR